MPSLDDVRSKATDLKTSILGRTPFSSSSSPSDRPAYVRPIGELRDPASFPPPPRRRPLEPKPPAGHDAGHAADGTNSGDASNAVQWSMPPPPSKPYRINTTGLDTARLPPPPPTRRDGADGRPAAATALSLPPTVPPKPALPPRLPPRAGSSNRVPPPPTPITISSVPTSSTTTSAPAAAVRNLSRNWEEIAKADSAGPDAVCDAGAGIVNRAAVSAADDFRRRHGDEVVAGARRTGDPERKFGIAERVGGRLGGLPRGGHPPGKATDAAEEPSRGDADGHAVAAVAGQVVVLALKKKPPPPPPSGRKPTISDPGDRGGAAGDAPPPVPLASKPRF